MMPGVFAQKIVISYPEIRLKKHAPGAGELGEDKPS